MKVYELRFHDYEFYHVVGVFELKEDAEKVMAVGIAALDTPSNPYEGESKWAEERFSVIEVNILPPGSDNWTAKDIVDELEAEGWEIADWFILPIEDED